MELTRLHRVGLLFLGAAALGGAITMSIMDLGGAAAIAGVIGLIFPGFLVIIFAIVGVFPNVHLKEGSIDWAKIEPVGGFLTKEEFERQREIIADERSRSEVALRAELTTVSERLEDYILAHEPAPKDEDCDHPLADDERLNEMYQAYSELQMEASRRSYAGVRYDDGIDFNELCRMRDRAREVCYREARRQNAQYRFGMRDMPVITIT